MITGVSIVICCYNSTQRLPQTLAHLAAQKVADVPWEVIVIDNASTDNTAEVAKICWASENSVPLRVVHEPQAGLSHARHRGFQEAKYDLICLVDDDNWVCPEWVQTIAEIMSEHPDIGACGGSSQAASDMPLPWWFADYQDAYAIGEQTQQVGDITQTRGFLWGAGLTIRKKAWQQLLDGGFQPLLSDRKGATLASCGDYEFCLALRLAKWQLWYDPRLHFCHYVPASRLQWSYLRRLKRGFGASSVGLDPYSFLLNEDNLSLKTRLMQNWYFRLTLTLVKLLRYPYKLLLSSSYLWEGDSEIINVEILLGRLSELMKQRQVYHLNATSIAKAPWILSVKN